MAPPLSHLLNFLFCLCQPRAGGNLRRHQAYLGPAYGLFAWLSDVIYKSVSPLPFIPSGNQTLAGSGHWSDPPWLSVCLLSQALWQQGCCPFLSSWVSPFLDFHSVYALALFFWPCWGQSLVPLSVDRSTPELKLRSSTVFFFPRLYLPQTLLRCLLYPSRPWWNPTKSPVASVFHSVSAALTSPSASSTAVDMPPSGVAGDSEWACQRNVHHSFFMPPSQL